jgi:hypothetical protein
MFDGRPNIGIRDGSGRSRAGLSGVVGLVLLAIGFASGADVALGQTLNGLPDQPSPSIVTNGTVGDFNLLVGPLTPGDRIDMQVQNPQGDFRTGTECEISAGELWQYFRDRGVTSVESLILYVDVDPMDDASALSLDSMELSIRGDRPGGEIVKLSSLADGSGRRLLIQGAETSSQRPEAKVEIPLGFDFMDRFSSESKERLLVNVGYGGDLSRRPILSLSSRRPLLTAPSLVILAAFVIFWAVVFWILKRLTLPRQPAVPESSSRKPKSGNVLPAA